MGKESKTFFDYLPWRLMTDNCLFKSSQRSFAYLWKESLNHTNRSEVEVKSVEYANVQYWTFPEDNEL